MKIASTLCRALVLGLLSSIAASAITPEQFATLQTRSPRPSAASLEAVAAAGKKVVAVGTRGGAVKSLDGGLTWSAMPGIERLDMYGVATDGTRFVGVGSVAGVTTDLETWERSPDRLPGLALDITYGGGIFVAGGRADAVSTSVDGLEWTDHDLPEGTSLEGIAYGNGVYVGAGWNARIVTSSNGTDWEITKPDDDTEGRFGSVRFTNGRFVAAGGQGLLYTSVDGRNWSKPSSENAVNLSQAVYFKGQYVILNTLSSTELTTDFITFERNRLGFNGGPNGLVETEGRLIAVGSSGLLATSEDGVTWVERRDQLGSQFDSVVFENDVFVMSDVGEGRLFTSSNGAVWTQRYQAVSGIRTKIAYGDGKFCVFDGGLSVVSDDGRTWEGHQTGLPSISDSLRYLNGRFFVVGRSGLIASSPDGITWTELPTGSDVFLVDINYLDGTYVAIGGDDSLLTTTDLLTWTSRSSGLETTDNKDFSRIEVYKDHFVLFQWLGTPAISTNGIDWSFVEASNMRIFSWETGVDPDLGVYALASGQVIYNPNEDFTTWSRLSVPVSENFLALAEGNGAAVGAGNNGLVMSTPLSAGGYEGWATEAFGASAPSGVSGASADPDGDGIRNLEEYVRATNPNQSSAALPIGQRSTSFGPEISWTQQANLADVQTVIEHSADMKAWTTEGISLNEGDVIQNNQTFTARITGEAGLERSRYLRLRWVLIQ